MEFQHYADEKKKDKEKEKPPLSSSSSSVLATIAAIYSSPFLQLPMQIGVGDGARRTGALVAEQQPLSAAARDAAEREAVFADIIRQELMVREIVERRMMIEAEVRREVQHALGICRNMTDIAAGGGVMGLPAVSRRPEAVPLSHMLPPAALDSAPASAGPFRGLPAPRPIEGCQQALSNEAKLGASSVCTRGTKRKSQDQLALSEYLSGKKNKTEEIQMDVGKKAQETGQSFISEADNMWRCTLCQVNATSIICLKEHLSGKKHKNNETKAISLKKLPENTDKPLVEEDNADGTNAFAEIANKGEHFCNDKETQLVRNESEIKSRKQKRFYCNVCNVECNSNSMLTLHFIGKKHKKLEKLKSGFHNYTPTITKIGTADANTGDEETVNRKADVITEVIEENCENSTTDKELDVEKSEFLNDTSTITKTGVTESNARDEETVSRNADVVTEVVEGMNVKSTIDKEPDVEATLNVSANQNAKEGMESCEIAIDGKESNGGEKLNGVISDSNIVERVTKAIRNPEKSDVEKFVFPNDRSTITKTSATESNAGDEETVSRNADVVTEVIEGMSVNSTIDKELDVEATLDVSANQNAKELEGMENCKIAINGKEPNGGEKLNRVISDSNIVERVTEAIRNPENSANAEEVDGGCKSSEAETIVEFANKELAWPFKMI